MKNDPCFKYLAVTLIAAVLLAFFYPARVTEPSEKLTTIVAGSAAAVSVKT